MRSQNLNLSGSYFHVVDCRPFYKRRLYKYDVVVFRHFVCRLSKWRLRRFRNFSCEIFEIYSCLLWSAFPQNQYKTHTAARCTCLGTKTYLSNCTIISDSESVHTFSVIWIRVLASATDKKRLWQNRKPILWAVLRVVLNEILNIFLHT
jgi:hypothetical protein